MLMEVGSFKLFISKFTNFEDINLDLETLVSKYRQTNDPRYFATIYNKVSGVIFKFGQRANNSLTSADMYSHGMEALYHALSTGKYGWKPESKIKFLTYYYRMVNNFVFTLQKSKHFRDFAAYHTSLDQLVDDPDNPQSFTEDQLYSPIRKTIYDKEAIAERLKEIGNNKTILSEMQQELKYTDSEFKLAFLQLKKKCKLANKQEKNLLKILLKNHK